MIEQGTSAWKKSRIGYFTGSRISELMVSGKKKGEMFGKTALSYIYEIAAERDLLPAYLDDDYLFEIYDKYINNSNKYMDFGRENESFAIERYELATGYHCEEVESLRHPSIKWFSASPDRIVSINKRQKIVAEVKCPTPKTFIEYKQCIHDNESLKAVEPKYYYQMQAEMMCARKDKADFIAFCPFLKNNIHIVRIKADKDVQKEIGKRIKEANILINEILKK